MASVLRRSRPCAQSMLMHHVSLRTLCYFEYHIMSHALSYPGPYNLSSVHHYEMRLQYYETALNKLCRCLKQLAIILLHLPQSFVQYWSFVQFSHELYLYLLCPEKLPSSPMQT